MADIAVSTNIACPPPEVFRILSNPPGYLPPSLRARWIKGSGPGVGSRWEEHYAIHGLPYRTQFEIVEFVPEAGRMVLEIKSFVAAYQERSVTASPEGSHVIIRVRYRVPGGPPGRLLDRLVFEPHGRTGLRTELERVKRVAENGIAAGRAGHRID